MTCLMFPFGDASWQPVAVVVDAALGLIVSAAELFVAAAAATASRHPTASAQRAPSVLRLIDVLPSCRWPRGTYRDPFRMATVGSGRSGCDVVRAASAGRRRAGALEPLGPGGAEEAPGRGLHEAHPVVHLLEDGLRGLAGLLGAAAQQALELRLVAAELLVGVPDRLEELDHRLADVDLEGAVALPVVAGLDRLPGLAGRHRHDPDEGPDSRRLR